MVEIVVFAVLGRPLLARLRRLRWRVARAVAPSPILLDPYPDQERPFIVLSHRWGEMVAIIPLTLDISMENNLRPLLFDPDRPWDYRPARPRGTITGTL